MRWIDLPAFWGTDLDGWSTTTTATWYDSNKYDLVPKPGYLDKEIKVLENEMAVLERNQKSTNEYYENRKRALLEEKEKLTRQKALKSG